ncbi:MAG: adenylate cyclase [Saprospiraceae bacterium]|nr:MAG: adenylate cyclase [Saprospiraceae bacterium]
MPHNVEIKARCKKPERIHATLRQLGADYRGCDHQIDTFFQIPPERGRLKLRQGQIENALIYYQRPDTAGPKTSRVILQALPPDNQLAELLDHALGTRIVVDKMRHIYFIDNVKFHVDEVRGLGTFVEIEAQDSTGKWGLEHLDAQCRHFMRVLGIEAADLLTEAYADMLEKSQP